MKKESMQQSLQITELPQSNWLIVPGRRIVVPGPIQLLAGGKELIMDVKSIIIKQLKDVSDEEAKEFGFFNCQFIQEHLQKVYVSLNDTDNITIIRFQ